MSTHCCSPSCTAGWGPGRKSHCTSCGENFTTPANFDRHRAVVAGERVCGNPLVMKLELNSRGLWQAPGEIDRAELFSRSVVSSATGKGHS